MEMRCWKCGELLEVKTKSLPPSIEYGGDVYSQTGKRGTDRATGKQSMEYSGENDRRLWLREDGVVTEADEGSGKPWKPYQYKNVRTQKSHTLAKYNIGDAIVYRGETAKIDNRALDSRGWVYSIVYDNGISDTVREENIR